MESQVKESKVLTAPEIERGGFVANMVNGIKSLLKGMGITFHYFSHPSTVVTQQYPENRETLKMFDRFRAQLLLKHDEKGVHKCSGCQICMEACPNASINVIQRKNPVTGKAELDRYIWRMDSCTFCNMCVMVCPFGTLEFGTNFETAVYDRRLFAYTLNQYAGPPANFIAKVASQEDLEKQIHARERFFGPIPLAGKAIDGLSAGKLESLGDKFAQEEPRMPCSFKVKIAPKPEAPAAESVAAPADGGEKK